MCLCARAPLSPDFTTVSDYNGVFFVFYFQKAFMECWLVILNLKINVTIARDQIRHVLERFWCGVHIIIWWKLFFYSTLPNDSKPVDCLRTNIALNFLFLFTWTICSVYFCQSPHWSEEKGREFALSKCLFSFSLISECCPGRLEKRTRWVEKCTEPYFGWWLEPKPPTCLCGPTRSVQHNNWKSAGRLAGAAGLTNPCGTLTVQRRCNGGPMVSIRDFGCICVVTTI